MFPNKDLAHFQDYKRDFDGCQARDQCAYELYKVDHLTRNKNLQRRYAEETEELKYEKYLLEAKEREENIGKILQEEKLAAEIAELNRQKICREQRRQRLRLHNEELKALESQLRNAYLAKGLQAQKQEKQAFALIEKAAAEKEKQEFEQARYKELEIQKIEQANANKRKKELRDALQDQIITSHQKEQFLYEEFLKEKRILDEIVRRIYEEHMEDMRLKMLKQQRTREDIENFKKAQEIWRERQRLQIEDENRRIIQFCEERDKKASDTSAERRAKEELRTQMNNKMCAELSNIVETKLKREALLQELYAFEKEEIEDRKELDEIEKNFRKRIQMRAGYNEQFMAKEARRKELELEEIAYKEQQMQFLAERDRIDQMSNEKRRRKMLEHRKAVQDILEDRRLQKAIQVTEQMKLKEIDAENEKDMQKLIEQERISMLKEHATDLIGFLPPGMLKESDLEHFPFPRNKK